MGPPVVAVAGPVLVTPRSSDLAAAVSEVDADAVLLAGVGSGSLPPMVAVLVMVPAVAGAVALIVIVALAPEASEPTRSEARRVGKERRSRGAGADGKQKPEGRGWVWGG